MHYKCSLIGTLLDREFKSSIINEAIRRISSLFIFYFLRNNFGRRKAPKRKINNFPPLRSFSARKIVAFIDSFSLVFVLLVDFCFICVFVRLNLFVKKNKQTKNCPDGLICNTTDVYRYQPTYRGFIYTSLCSWQSAGFFYIIICQNLFLPVRIHFRVCFLSFRIYFHLYAFVWMLKHQKYWFFLLKTLWHNFWLNYEY